MLMSNLFDFLLLRSWSSVRELVVFILMFIFYCMTPITSLFSGLIKRDPFAIYKEDISKSTFVTCAEKNVPFSAYD